MGKRYPLKAVRALKRKKRVEEGKKYSLPGSIWSFPDPIQRRFSLKGFFLSSSSSSSLEQLVKGIYIYRERERVLPGIEAVPLLFCVFVVVVVVGGGGDRGVCVEGGGYM